METVDALAEALGLTVEPDIHLAEGSGPTHVITLVEQAGAPLVLCSHGDVIGDVMHTIARRGIELDDDRLAKASTWVITVETGTIVAVRYVPPPTCP
jgi:broad specificity phosphatase PhoE